MSTPRISQEVGVQCKKDKDMCNNFGFTNSGTWRGGNPGSDVPIYRKFRMPWKQEYDVQKEVPWNREWLRQRRGGEAAVSYLSPKPRKGIVT